MNPFPAILQILSSVFTWVMSRKPAEPEQPAAAPEKPRGREIAAAEDARYEHDRAAHAPSTVPVILPPRSPLVSSADDRADDVGAMRGNGPPMDDEPVSVEPEPSTRRHP